MYSPSAPRRSEPTAVTGPVTDRPPCTAAAPVTETVPIVALPTDMDATVTVDRVAAPVTLRSPDTETVFDAAPRMTWSAPLPIRTRPLAEPVPASITRSPPTLRAFPALWPRITVERPRFVAVRRPTVYREELSPSTNDPLAVTTPDTVTADAVTTPSEAPAAVTEPAELRPPAANCVLPSDAEVAVSVAADSDDACNAPPIVAEAELRAPGTTILLLADPTVTDAADGPSRTLPFVTPVPTSMTKSPPTLPAAPDCPSTTVERPRAAAVGRDIENTAGPPRTREPVTVAAPALVIPVEVSTPEAIRLPTETAPADSEDTLRGVDTVNEAALKAPNTDTVRPAAPTVTAPEVAPMTTLPPVAPVPPSNTRLPPTHEA